MNLTRSLIIGNLHLKSFATVAQVLGDEHGAFLSDQEGGGVGIAGSSR